MNTAEPESVRVSYGPAVFVAALVNILIVELALWVTVPWFALAVFVIPLLVVDLGVAALLKLRKGTLRQVGHGMMIGLIAAPATVVVFAPGLWLVQAVGLV